MKKNIIAILVICALSLAAQAQTTKKSGTKKKSTKKTETVQPTTPAAAPSKEQPRAEVDKPNLDVKPNALQGTAFVFPKYEEFVLSNGLTVYVIENHEQPMVTMSMILRGGEAYDPVGKEGTAAVAGDMLSKGTKKRTALEIAKTLDGVGAGISVSSTGESMTISASTLTRHLPLVLGVLSDELREPIFDEQELAKLKQQYVASVASRRSRPLEIAQALSRKVIYGMDNPLARRSSEKSIKAITREDVVAFHANYIRPNSAAIAIVGDITPKEARDMLSKYLGGWEKGTRPEVAIADIATEPAGVYFVPRKGSVQSTVIVCAAGPAVREQDFDATSIMTSHLGSGFGSLLFNTLRETYSYTYSPFSLLTRGRRFNRIAAGAEVRTSVTDSAIVVMLREIRKLAGEGPEEEAIARRIALEAGQYRIAFERSSTVASILLNSWLNDVPIEDAKNYTGRIEALTSGDVQAAAAKYLGLFDLRLVVVGNPSVKDKLEQFGAIKEYTLDLEPVKESPLEAVTMTVEEIIAKYKEAIGGAAKVDSVRTLSSEGSVTLVMQGKDYSGTYTRVRMSPDKEYSSLNLGMMQQAQWVNGSQAWSSLMNGPAAPAPQDEVKQILLEARMFPFASLANDGYATKVLGKRDGVIMIEAVSPAGLSERYHVDGTTYLVVRHEKDEQGPQGVVTTIEKFSDYTDIDGIKLPKKVLVQNSVFSMEMNLTHTLNASVEQSMFEPPTK
ncbi:MAG: hypothetical protein RLZZ273_350 [Bacteroidota bacterium]